MKAAVRWMVVTILAIDVAFLAAVAVTELPLFAQSDPLDDPNEAMRSVLEQEASDRWTQATFDRLAEQLRERMEGLREERTRDEELARSEEVLRRAGLLVDEDASEAPATPAGPTPEAAAAFARLQRAYENMEPESAAAALSALAQRDREAVIELLIGWQPRTSGGILDAITQTDPALAADLSYEIWKRGGKEAPAAATDGP